MEKNNIAPKLTSGVSLTPSYPSPLSHSMASLERQNQTCFIPAVEECEVNGHITRACKIISTPHPPHPPLPPTSLSASYEQFMKELQVDQEPG